MNAVGWLGSYISQGVGVVSGPFHPFGGAIDVIVVEQPDGSFKSSPWYVRFGKFQGVLKTKEKIVNINVNGVEADFHMYLNHRGEAYFLKEVEVEEGEPVPCLSSSGDEMDGMSKRDRMVLKSKSCDFDVSKLDSVGEIDLNNGKVLARSSSRRSRILGFVFGRKSMKERELKDDGGPGMERTSSLDRAEFAADLLEVKWSTNLAFDKVRNDRALRLSTSNGGLEDDVQIESEHSSLRSLVLENDESNLLHNGLQEIATAHSKETGNNLDGLIEDVCLKMLCSSPQEDASATSVIIESVDEDIYVVSGKTDEHTIGNGDLGVEILNGCNSKNAGPNSQLSCLTMSKASPSKQFNGQKAVEEKDVSPGSRVLEESISERELIQSLNYCDELSERSVLEFNGSREQLHETICISSVSQEELHFRTGSVHASPDLQDESAVSEALDKHAGLEAVVTDLNYHFQPSNSSSNLVLQDSDNVNHQLGLQSSTQMVGIEPISDSVEQVKPLSDSAVSSLYDSSYRVQDEIITSDDQPFLGSSDYVQEKVSNDHMLNNSEEQFLFSDIDESKLNSAKCAGLLSLDYDDDKSHPIASPRATEEDNWRGNLNQESFLHSEESRPAKQLNDLESSAVMSETMSCPVNIPVSCKSTSEEGLRHVKSLANIPVHMEDLDANNICHPLSRSVDSYYKSKWALLRENSPHFKIKEAGQRNTEDTLNSVEWKNIFSQHAVEVSLCKHMLSEGMGADAASQAFDSQKLDIDKFSNMGTEILKDDRLVVRIGGHYFPWDAAAAHGLGFVSFGNDHVYKPRGLIPIEKAEDLLEGYPSKASPGSWRLWPFSFKGSISRKAMHPDLNGARIDAHEDALESTIGAAAQKEVHTPKVVKKPLRTKTPTSEQLASLKLKEGMNLVTFTFSTPMLGKQQVDARIYLWKWNTRVVISDVDGTITKSDVLGQFMPLVGVDWTQTGVTNLFSAIKENGYQLLFLSARAISQAYHTRQYLFNLKQDGKALPDGPVCISPDGLFPSLIREVIRRVPHEFKIACLEDIKALFPSDCNPFYAGFGNRDTDEISYLKVGIPRGKIFIINPRGEVALNRCVDTKSYTSLHALVNGMFPPMSSSEQEDYNQWNYWKLPTPTIDL